MILSYNCTKWNWNTVEATQLAFLTDTYNCTKWNWNKTLYNVPQIADKLIIVPSGIEIWYGKFYAVLE